jgi:hypothetical protein
MQSCIQHSNIHSHINIENKTKKSLMPIHFNQFNISLRNIIKFLFKFINLIYKLFKYLRPFCIIYFIFIFFSLIFS